MDEEIRKVKKKSTIQGVILLMVALSILVGIGINRWKNTKNSVQQLFVSEDLMEIIPAEEEVYINANQIVKFTKDGVTSYSFKGEELWRDTLNLEDLWIVQRDPYLAVTSKHSREIILFNEKGRIGTISTTGLIGYFSMNERGSVVAIEENEEGHTVSTYTNEGGVLGVARKSYIENGGFPMVAEISPNNESLFIGYVNVKGPSITSSIICVPIEVDGQVQIDNISFGIDQKDNLIYEIEFINEKTWVSIGDQMTTFYTLTGEEIKTQQGLYASYNPYLTKKAARGQTLPIVASGQVLESTVHNKEELYFFDETGEAIERHPLESTVTYFRADDKGAIIGQGRNFIGYNKMGLPYFEFNAMQDIESVVYLDKYAIAIGKTKVMRIDPVIKEEE